MSATDTSPALDTGPMTLSPGKGRLLVATLLVLAGAAGAVAVTRWSADPRRFAFAYLTAYAFVASVGAGALAWLMIQHAVSAFWSVALRRLLENLTRPLPWLALLFLPIALNLPRLYPWADPARVRADAELARKAVWLNPVAFDARAAVYVFCWAGLAGLLARASTVQDRSGDPAPIQRMRATSRWGLIVLGLTTSLAAFDWLMPLDPHWSSTVFGVYFWAGGLVAALAALTLLVLGLQALGALGGVVTIEHLHDLGKLLFSFVIFWAYIAFCQYFLIWYANLPEETEWYITRRSGSWNTLSWLLFFGHFVVPFALLLPRATKRDPFWLGFVSAWILVFHYADLYWLVMPALRPDGLEPSGLDAALVLALAGFCGAIVARACQVRPLVPQGDPRLAASIAFRNR
jgi:hypothetical protein